MISRFRRSARNFLSFLTPDRASCDVFTRCPPAAAPAVDCSSWLRFTTTTEFVNTIWAQDGSYGTTLAIEGHLTSATGMQAVTEASNMSISGTLALPFTVDEAVCTLYNSAGEVITGPVPFVINPGGFFLVNLFNDDGAFAADVEYRFNICGLTRP